MLAPQRVERLVLVDAALGIAQGAPQPAPALTRSLLGIQPLRDGLVATFLTNPRFTRRLLQKFIADPARATDAWIAVYRRPLDVAGSTAAVGQWLPELIAPAVPAASENPAAYAALTMPIVLIWGREDTITPLAQAERLKTLAPHATLKVLDGVGHIPQIEDAERFRAALLEAVTKP